MGNSPCSRNLITFTKLNDTQTQETHVEESPVPKVVQKGKTNLEAHLQDVVSYKNVPLDEDTFGMMTCSITRDAFFLSNGAAAGHIRRMRMVVCVFLLLFTMFLQVWIMAKVRKYITAKEVHDIRLAYSEFEQIICGEHVTLTQHGHYRCTDGSFPGLEVAKARIHDLPTKDKEQFCRIPLSQPVFFFTALLIWTFTCIAEIRKAVGLQITQFSLKTIEFMRDAQLLEEKDDDTDDNQELVIRGMTLELKALLFLSTFLPRVGITSYLCWVGCRWLVATNNFSNLLLNALALEFILIMKTTIYTALMPSRSKRDLEVTFIHPVWRKTAPGPWTFANTTILLVVACVWVYVYMRYFQTVLPNYQWDIHEVCRDFLLTRYEV